MQKIEFSNNWKIDASVYAFLKKNESSKVHNVKKRQVKKIKYTQEIEALRVYENNLLAAYKQGLATLDDLAKVTAEIRIKVHEWRANKKGGSF